MKRTHVNKKVDAILCADIHLSHNPPVLRSKEPDWYNAMRQVLYWLQETRRFFKCPILAAGDILNYWNCCPELINFAMTYLPVDMYCIPGQHDTPNHNPDEMEKSAYYSLVLSDTIKDLECVVDTQLLKHFNLYSFAYGEKIKPPKKETTVGPANIALCHQFIWHGKHRYKTAARKTNINYIAKKNMIDNKLFGYDVMVFGDNHKGFLTKIGDTTVFNCGTLMRRRTTDLDYRPQVGLLHPDGEVTVIRIPIKNDVYLETKTAKALEENPEIDISELSKELKSMEGQDIDFELILKNYLRKKNVKVNKRTRELLFKAAEKERDNV